MKELLNTGDCATRLREDHGEYWSREYIMMRLKLAVKTRQVRGEMRGGKAYAYWDDAVAWYKAAIDRRKERHGL